MNKCSDYKNKYFSVLGDSISTFEGCSVPNEAVFYNEIHKKASGVLSLQDTWWGEVIDRLDGNLLVNNSFSGSTVCWHPTYKTQCFGCSDERTSSLDKDGIFPDVIMVYLGTNDWRCGIRVVPDARFNSSDDLTVFSTAYRKMIEKIKKNYPNAEIWCFTLAVSKCTAVKNFSFPYYYGGRDICEYCEMIRTCASEYNCRIIDLYTRADLYDTFDGFHATASGMKTIAKAVIDELSEK